MILKSLLKAITLTGLSFLISQGALATSAEQLLARDFRAAKISFGQEKRLYHYFDIHNAESPEVQTLLSTPGGRQALARSRIQYGAGKFWSPQAKINGLFAGEGLYLAVDPLISEEYGTVMIEFKVKPETFYLNLKQGVFLRQDTIQALYAEGYKTREPGETLPESMRFSDTTLNAMLTPENRLFRQLVLQTLRAENVMLMEYNWRSELASICGEDSSTSAFVYVGTNEELPEFSAVEFVDVKNAYDLQRLSRRERIIKKEIQQLLSVMKMNADLDSREEQIRNQHAIYKNESHIKAVLETLFGCTP